MKIEFSLFAKINIHTHIKKRNKKEKTCSAKNIEQNLVYTLY